MPARKRVAILCINPWELQTSWQPFSYAAYCVAASLHDHPRAGEVRVIEGFRWSVERWVETIEAFDPDVVGASSYLWSLPTFVEVMAALRRRESRRGSKRVHVLGGPSARVEMVTLPPYASAIHAVDALVLGEGELAIREIVDASDASELAGVAGLAVVKEGAWHRTGARASIEDLDTLPSPFQLGMTPPGVTGHLELFRGCPLSCMFCQWGAGDRNGSFRSAEFLTRELEAFRDVKVTGVYNVDAGLNLHAKAFKNLLRADEQVKLLRHVDFACELYPSYVSDQQIELLQEIAHPIVGVGLQTYNPKALAAMDRPFDPSRFEKNVARLAEVADTSVELIVGLPGDDPASFMESLRRALELPCNLRVYRCLVLPDALLTRGRPDFALEFDPITLQIESCLGWSRRDLMATMEALTEACIARGGSYTVQALGSNEPCELFAGRDDRNYCGSTSSSWYFPGPKRARDERDNQNFLPSGRFSVLSAPKRSLPVVETERVENERVPGPAPALRLDRAAAEASLAALTQGSWSLAGASPIPGGLLLSVRTPHGELGVTAEKGGAARPHYRVKNDIAFAYRNPPSGALDAERLRVLDRFLDTLDRFLA